MPNTNPSPTPPPVEPQDKSGQPGQAPSPRRPDAGAAEIADAVVDKIGNKVAGGGAADSRAADSRVADSLARQTDIPSVSQAIALREQAPEMYDLWLKIAKDKAATANYVDRAPYEVPERLAQSGRPRALGALIIVLSFCGYLAWLGGPGVYIGGVIAILDLIAMLAVLFALRPDRLAEPRRAQRPRRRRLAPG